MLQDSWGGIKRSWCFNRLRSVSLVMLVAAFLLSGPVAQAGVVGKATLVKDPGAGMPFLAPDAALPAGFVSYQLSIEGTYGDVIGAVDVSITGGLLHQRWIDADLEGFTSPSANGRPSDGRGDSHLTAPVGSPFGFGPTETNSKTGSPLKSFPDTTEYGFGDLYGAWAILNPTTTNNIAYLVFKKEDLASIQIVVRSASAGVGTEFRVLTTTDFFVPEPLLMALACPALAASCTFRRRWGTVR